MTDAVRLIPTRQLKALELSQRRLRWGLLALGCAAVALGLAAAGRAPVLKLPSSVRIAEASSTDVIRSEHALLSVINDPLYDRFLQEFKTLRADPDRRRYLIAQVLVAAAVHHVDPDLLFSLIAAESRFDSEAISPKGARGLGQMKFTTAQAVAPETVRRPEDLHDVARNLYATALHLRQLLVERGGDVRSALRAYYAGGFDRNAASRDREQYVARVSTHYAYLKGMRTHRIMTAGQSGEEMPAVP